jgi:hypothetical protein
MLREIRNVIMNEWKPIETAPKDGTLVDLWVVHSSFGFVTGQIYRDCKWRADKDTWQAQHGYGVVLDWQHIEEEDGSVTTSRPTHWVPVMTRGPNGEKSGSYLKTPHEVTA